MPRNEAVPRQAGKRPVKPLSAQEKVDAIQRVQEGESKASVARDIGVPESTLRGWCKAQHKLLNQAKNQSNSFEGSIVPIESGSELASNDSRGSGSLSRSPPNCIGVSNLAREDGEEILKRPKVETCTTVNNSMPNLMVNTSSQAHGLSYNGDFNNAMQYQRIINNMINSSPDAARIIQQNSLYAHALLLNANGLQYSRNNGAISSSMNMTNNPSVTNSTIIANKVVLNGENKRKLSSTTTRQALNSNRRHTSSIVEGASSERSATPLTSGIINGGTIESSTNRPRQETRSFDEIMQQFQAQQLQQQQTAVTDFFSQTYQKLCSTILANSKKEENNEVAERKKRLEEALEQNKNKTDEDESRPGRIPQGIDEALNHARDLEKWLKEFGSPYITLANLKTIQTIINKLKVWMEGGNRSEEQPSNNNTAS